MAVDRFGNPHAPNLPYARGKILSSTEDDIASVDRERSLVLDSVAAPGTQPGHQEGKIGRREAATGISSLAVIGFPPSTFSCDGPGSLGTYCAMVRHSDKEGSLSFGLGDGSRPFSTLLLC